MSKRLKRKFGISRRIGASLWGSQKDSCNKKNYPPGMHGNAGYKRCTVYGSQLIAKQKLKKYYGDIREKQFKNIYKEAIKRKGDTRENLVGLLESRLDSFIYRSKFAPTVFASRQFVTHKHVTVNNKVINIPSYRLKVNDTIKIRNSMKKSSIVTDANQRNERKVPEYIEVDYIKMQAVLLKIPTFIEIPFPIQIEPNLIVEFYSR